MRQEYRLSPIGAIKPNPQNTRTHPRDQIRWIARSIEKLGFAGSIIVDEDSVILAGHGRYEDAKTFGPAEIPTIVMHGLSDLQKRTLLLADNKLAEQAGWDRERLSSS